MQKKPNKNQRNMAQYPLSDKLLSKLKKRFDFGNGVEIAHGSEIDKKTGKTVIKYAYSNKFPKLEITSKGAKRSIRVEVSSIEQENDQLLHNLFISTKSS